MSQQWLAKVDIASQSDRLSPESIAEALAPGVTNFDVILQLID